MLTIFYLETVYCYAADCYSISGDDVDFFMMFIDSKVDVSHKFKLSADIPELILRGTD